MILQLIRSPYRFHMMEDLEFHLLKDATKEDLDEYKEYLEDQLLIINEILS